LLTYSSHITTLSSRFASDRFLNWPQNPPMAIVIWEFWLCWRRLRLYSTGKCRWCCRHTSRLDLGTYRPTLSMAARY